MFDIGWQEIFIVGILALIVVGPKDLPRAMKMAMGWVRKARSMAREFQSGIDDMVREADLDDVKKQISEGSSELKKDLEDTVGTDIAKDLDLSDDEAQKIISGKNSGIDVGEVLEPSDDGGSSASGASDDDDDVMPIASKPVKTDKTTESSS